MKLNLIERLVILSIVPKEGSFVTLKITNELMSKVGLTSEDLIYYEVVEDTTEGKVKWNPEKGKEEVEIDLKEKEKDLVKEALKKLDSEEKMTNDHVSLYKKFIGE